MKQILKNIIALLVISLPLYSKAQVSRVIDGDTFEAIYNGQKYKCRILNIDAPESKQAFGAEAKNKLQELLIGNAVIIESVKKDRYKRILVNVTAQGKRIDSLMIREGFAWHYSDYSKDKELAKYQEEAMVEKKGLWKCGKEAICPPWLFRHYTNPFRVRHCKGC